MKKIVAPTYKAEITFGLNKGYSDHVWTLEEFKTSLTIVQQSLKDKTRIGLSAKVTPCSIVFLGQDEKSVTVSFINYPRFPLEKTEFKEGVLFIGQELMNRLEQNRIVIVFDDETIMFEESQEIDSRINQGVRKN